MQILEFEKSMNNNVDLDSSENEDKNGWVAFDRE